MTNKQTRLSLQSNEMCFFDFHICLCKIDDQSVLVVVGRFNVFWFLFLDMANSVHVVRGNFACIFCVLDVHWREDTRGDDVIMNDDDK